MDIFKLFRKSMPEPKSEEDILIERAFSRKNILVDMLYEFYVFSPGRKKVNECFDEMAIFESYSHEFTIDVGNNEKDILILNRETKPYIEQLMKMHVQSRKIASIIYPLNREKDELLLAELMPAINLMIQAERGLRKGVPIGHNTVKSAVFSINAIVEEALSNYYTVSLLDLNMELKLAKEMRVEYQKRREKWIEDTKVLFDQVQINKTIQ